MTYQANPVTVEAHRVVSVDLGLDSATVHIALDNGWSLTTAHPAIFAEPGDYWVIEEGRPYLCSKADFERKYSPLSTDPGYLLQVMGSLMGSLFSNRPMTDPSITAESWTDSLLGASDFRERGPLKAKLVIEDGTELEGHLATLKPDNETREIWSDGSLEGQPGIPRLVGFACAMHLDVRLDGPFVMSTPQKQK